MPVGWEPSDLGADLKAEWNIAQQAGESDGVAIVQLNDTGGSGLHGTQGTAGNRAIYRAGRLNGLGAAEFVSTDRYESTLSASTLNESYIAVIRSDGFAGSPTILGDNAGGGRQWRIDAAGRINFVRAGTTNIGQGTKSIVAGRYHIVFGTLKNGAQVYAIDGDRETGSAAAALTASRTTQIGARSGTVEPWDGDILYVAVCAELTQTEQEYYEGHLARLFGIPLVAGHAEVNVTRFYYPSSGTPDITPAFDASWDDSEDAVRYPMPLARGSSAMATITSDEPATTTNNLDYLAGQWISPPLVGGTFGGLLLGQMRVSESNAAANYRAQMVVRLMAPDGVTVRGTLFAGDVAALANEFATSLTNRFMPRGSAVAATSVVTWQDGDHLVVEPGLRAQNTENTARTGSFRIGENDATPLPRNETATADNHPWLDIAYPFEVYTPPLPEEIVRHAHMLQ